MIYTVFSLVALVSLSSSNRRLLQMIPPISAQPVQPEFVPVNPVEPAQPAAPAQPVEPAQPAQPQVVLPTDPQPAQPTQPPQPVIPMIPQLTIPPAPPTQLLCNLPYTAVGSCAGQIKTISNAAEKFLLNCNSLGSCAQSRITFEYPLGGPFIESIEAIMFTEAYAGYGATVTIDNQQGTNKVVVERLECAKETSCNGLTIILINAHLNDMECSSQSECQDCWIKMYGPLDPNPKSCYGW